MPDTSYDPYGRPVFMNASHHFESPEGSPHGYPRNRGDATPLLMLPAPLAVSSTTGTPVTTTPSASSSLTDAAPVRAADPSMVLSPYSQDTPVESERGTMLIETNPIVSGRTPVNMGPNAVIRAAPGQTAYPVETQNPYHHSQPQMVTYDQA